MPAETRQPTAEAAPRPGGRGARTGHALLRAGGIVLGGLARWSPVWGAVVLFGQVSLLGMRPVLEEREALARHEERLRERHERLDEELRRVEAWLRAQDDPVYRERVRRLLLEPDAGR